MTCMARLARVVMERTSHHVAQRRNCRQTVFFSDDDYGTCKALLAEGCAAADVAIWAYCLMPNHVHLILVPGDTDGLRAALSDTHRRYSRGANFREGWRGYLWQGRFASTPMDDGHLMVAARYVELNPVRAKLAARAEDWPWSSARAHLTGRNDEMVDATPLLEREPDWARFLAEGLDPQVHAAIQSAELTGRPLGDDAFTARLEHSLGRTLTRRKPGRKPRPAAERQAAVL